MKLHIFVTLLLSTFFLFIPEGKTQHPLIGEIELSTSPFALCQCATSPKDDSCRNNYENWGIINDTNIQSFDDSFDQEDAPGQYPTEGSSHALRMFRKTNLLVLSLKNGTLASGLFNGKKIIIFCSESIHQSVERLKITKAAEIYFLPEAISERKGHLDIHFRNVQKDLYLPSNLYNYDYKITDDDDWAGNQTSLNETSGIGATINIQLYEVRGVYISSHCISAKSLLLKIDGAKFLTMERTAVRNNYDLFHSGLSLRKINTVKTECTWGSHLTIESCDQVYFDPNSLSESILSIFIANINNLNSYESFLYSNSKFDVILNVKLWNIIRTDDVILPPKIFSFTEQKIAVKKQKSTLVINNTNINFVNMEDEQFLKYSIIISNSTFERENHLNSSLSMIAYNFNIEKNQSFPDWVHLCKINDYIVCENFHQFSNVCAIGFPYQLNHTIQGQIECHQILPRYIPDIEEILIQLIVGGGLLLFVILTFVSILLICRYKKLSGKWIPDRGQGTLISSRHSTSFEQHQVIVLPSRDPDYCFNTFPRHFSRSLSPLSSEAGFKYYTYHDNFTVQTHENRQNNKNKPVQSIQKVQLLHVNNDYEDVPLRESNGHLKKGNCESSSIEVTQM